MYMIYLHKNPILPETRFIKYIKTVFILSLDREIQKHQQKYVFLHFEKLYSAARPKVLISKLKQTMAVN